MSSIKSRGLQIAITDTLIEAATGAGHYRGVQNLDATNAVHITLGGNAATALNGVRVGPGEFFEWKSPNNRSEVRGIAITALVNIVFLRD